jgi:acylphosphatase
MRKRVVVSGDVQGVFFRDTSRRLALRSGVAGWVRNLPDGRVEAVFEGDAAAVDRLVDWARQGPREARVERVEVYDEPSEALNGFEVRPTPRF